ncbi:MAG: GntR family transcriptional regulator [Chloroflexi bacterium]|nr:GntR family transcriptional regulator [Chloroflexota bacterium]
MRRKAENTQKTKKDVLVEMLRTAILSGELQPGERLIQEELAERFKVSPTPVREAIQQLVAEGVLSHSPYKGVQVAEVQAEDVRQVYLIRGALEQLAVRLAVPNLRIADVKRMHVIQTEMQTQLAANGRSEMLALNREFHMMMYERAEMPILKQMIMTLWMKSPWDSMFVVPHRAEMVLNEHQRILDGIDQGDAEQASAAMLHHIESGLQALVSYLDGK